MGKEIEPTYFNNLLKEFIIYLSRYENNNSDETKYLKNTFLKQLNLKNIGE